MIDLPPVRRHRRHRGGCGAPTGNDCEQSCTTTAAVKCRCPHHATPDTPRQRSAAARPRPPRGFRACARRTRVRHGRSDRRSPRKHHHPRDAPGPQGPRRSGPGQVPGLPPDGTQRLSCSPPYAQFGLNERGSPAGFRPRLARATPRPERAGFRGPARRPCAVGNGRQKDKRNQRSTRARIASARRHGAPSAGAHMARDRLRTAPRGSIVPRGAVPPLKGSTQGLRRANPSNFARTSPTWPHRPSPYIHQRETKPEGWSNYRRRDGILMTQRVWH